MVKFCRGPPLQETVQCQVFELELPHPAGSKAKTRTATIHSRSRSILAPLFGILPREDSMPQVVTSVITPAWPKRDARIRPQQTDARDSPRVHGTCAGPLGSGP